MEVVESLLTGNYKIIQDTDHYRFSSDSVLLSRFLTAKKGETVADFCAGSGIVGLNFYALNTGISSVTLFEASSALAAMAKKSVALNALEEKFTVVETRVQDVDRKYTEFFSLVLCNPPYERGGFECADPKKAACKKELTLTLGELCAAAKRCLKFGGRFALVHRADRLAEILYTLHEHSLEPKIVEPIAGKAGAKPYAVLVCAVKGGKAGVELRRIKVNDGEGI